MSPTPQTARRTPPDGPKSGHGAFDSPIPFGRLAVTRATGRSRGRVLEALFKTLACFAITHQVLLLVHFAIHRDLTILNVFTMLEAHRLVPALDDGAAVRFLSFLLAFGVYAVMYARFTSRTVADDGGLLHSRSVNPGATAPQSDGVVGATHRNGTAHGAHEGPVAAQRPGPRGIPLTVATGFLALVTGLAVHMSALASIEHFVSDFPPVPDVLQAQLPYVDFGPPGELAFAVFLASVAAVLFRRQPSTVPAILAQLGLFYAIRGVFLFLLPIGVPPTSPAPTDRFVFWPYAEHAYFPGGHTGMMTVLSLSVISTRWRRAFLAATVAFAVGTVIARTHYVADALGGALVAYAVVSWGRRHVRPAIPARLLLSVPRAEAPRHLPFAAREVQS